MSTDQQYYTPFLSSIFDGYECECDINGPIGTPHWEALTIRQGEYPMDWRLVVENGVIRTAFLAKEAIEDEGWFCRSDQGTMTDEEIPHPVSVFAIPAPLDSGRPGYTLLLHHDESRKIVILRNGKPIYNGPCPSVNEFRKLTQWLGIKKEETVKA